MVTNGNPEAAPHSDAATIRLAHRVCDDSLDWLDRVRALFALPRDVADHEITGDALKSLSELALAAGVVRREAVSGPRGASAAERLLDFAWREFREGDLLYQLQRHTPAATHPLEIYSMFAAVGYRHAPFERLAAHLGELRAWRVPEHVPNRRLAVVAATRRVGLPAHDDPAALTGQTWLGGTPEPWMLDANNAYGLTHTVFHLTDWGADPEGLPPELEEYLHRWLCVWVEVFKETGFWDLLAELLAVGACLRRPLLFGEVWSHLAHAQHDDGMVPNGVTRPAENTSVAFRNHHHPTIVAVVAATLTVARALRPAPQPA
ncbi:DUF6895 family protein [Halostreptopolyspora alba]|uniref:DUF6895 domain-containing protein n=1 Tax=Halostreptopolyspora alba TaxID=2487137 RepID=A0A3N0E2S1_9ACTN|nr:hypothetical protein EFW17_20190 [Nocardiopsaceae bacterium YIM 96095]